MPTDDGTLILRARDFWASLVLGAVSVFFLWKTSAIPLSGERLGGVKGIQWYESAAIVPLGIFSGLLVLSLVLLTVAIRSGGARAALTAAGIGWDQGSALRFGTLAAILLAYIAGLVPRVDFVISSGLLITALIYGYQNGQQDRMIWAAAIVCLAGGFALFSYRPQSTWNEHGDDWVALALWIALALQVLWLSRREPILRAVLPLAILAPLVLVCAMAFGFRQNVPARGGLIFKQIEYRYYVTLKPLWAR